MTRLPKATVLLLLIGLACVNLVFRYPTAQHEGGADSFVFQGLAQLILDAKHADWLISPLSVLGLYPLSHPSGSILSISDLTEVGGVQVEGSILLVDMLTSILGGLGAFVMAREIRTDDRLALLVAFVFSTAPRFVSSLEWQVPTRSLFTAVIPLFVWGLLRMHKRVDVPHIAVLSTTLLVMMTAHRLAVMMAIVMAAYIAASIFVAVLRILRTTYASVFLAPRLRLVLRSGSWCVLVIIAVYFLLFSGTLDAYEKGQFGTQTGLVGQLENLGVSLARTIGFLIPLVAVGAVAVVRTRGNDVRQPWLIAVLIGILPTLSLRQYTGWYLLPFAAIYIALGVQYLHDRLRARPGVRVAFIAVVLVTSFASTVYVANYERQLEQYLSSPVYDGGIYMRQVSGGGFIANSGALGVQVHAVSGLPYLPIGGSTTAFQGPEILAFHFLRPNDVRPRLIPIGSLTIEDDSFFVLDDVNFETIWADTLGRPVSDSYVSQQLSTYGIQFFVEKSSLSSSFEAYGNVYDSQFARSCALERYVVFSSGTFSVFYLQGSSS